MRSKPTRIFKAIFYFNNNNRIGIRDSLLINGERYIVINLEELTGTGEFTAHLWKIYKDYTGIDIIDIEEEPVPPTPIPDSSLLSGIPASQGIETYYEEFYNVTDNFIVLAFALNAYVSESTSIIKIKTQWSIIVNGIKFRYKDFNASPTLERNEFTFDLVENKILFGIDMRGAYIEVIYIKV